MNGILCESCGREFDPLLAVAESDQALEHAECWLERHVYCNICDEWHGQDHNCRHLYWSDHVGWWNGSGSDEASFADEHMKPNVQEFAHFVEATVEERFTEKLIRALKKDSFEFSVHGWINRGTFLFSRGSYTTRIYDSFVYDYAMDTVHREIIIEGACWLTTLEPEKTRDMTLKTVKWLEAPYSKWYQNLRHIRR